MKTHSTYTVYKRIANLILVLIGIAIGINLWWVNQKQTEIWYGIQAQQLGRSMSQQKAFALTQSVRQKDLKKITIVLEQLVSDKHVTAAAAYDFRGRMLAKAGTSQLSDLTFVADIMDDKTANKENKTDHNTQVSLVGYLKVQLAADAVMSHHNDFQSQLTNQGIVFMLLAALGALYITRAFYKMRFKLQRQLKAKARLLGKR